MLRRAATERGVGNVFNAPLPPGADGTRFREAWSGALLPAVEVFAPELIVPDGSHRARSCVRSVTVFESAAVAMSTWVRGPFSNAKFPLR